MTLYGKEKRRSLLGFNKALGRIDKSRSKVLYKLLLQAQLHLQQRMEGKRDRVAARLPT